MAGFSSQDDMVNEISTNGKFYRTDWQKSTFATTAHTAGLWYSLMRGGGNPPADTILGTGTNLAFQALSDAVATASGIPHGGNVGDYKVLLNAAAQTAAATTAPCVLMLVDLLGFYPITSVTTTGAQTLNNTVTLPRYTDGAGVQAFLTPSTVMGAATPNITLNYTNSAGTAGKATPATLPIGNTGRRSHLSSIRARARASTAHSSRWRRVTRVFARYSRLTCRLPTYRAYSIWCCASRS